MHGFACLKRFTFSDNLLYSVSPAISVNLEFICHEFGNYLSSLKYGHRHEESPEHLTFGGGWINGVVQTLEGYPTCFQHDKKFQELLDRQVQFE
jgi:hypothetical protein